MGEDPKYRTLPERMLTRLDFPPLRRKVFRNQGFIHVRVGRTQAGVSSIMCVPSRTTVFRVSQGGRIWSERGRYGRSQNIVRALYQPSFPAVQRTRFEWRRR